jgi:hypothetical protein
MSIKIIIVCSECKAESEPVDEVAILPKAWIGVDWDMTDECYRTDASPYWRHFCGKACLLAWMNKH